MDKNIKFTNTFFIDKAHLLNKYREGSFKLAPSLTKKIVKISDNEYNVSIKVMIKDTEENPFPFDLEVIGTLKTIFDSKSFSEKELDDYLNITCIQALYPFVRSSVANLCTASLVSPVLMPIMDVTKMIKAD